MLKKSKYILLILLILSVLISANVLAESYTYDNGEYWITDSIQNSNNPRDCQNRYILTDAEYELLKTASVERLMDKVCEIKLGEDFYYYARFDLWSLGYSRGDCGVRIVKQEVPPLVTTINVPDTTPYLYADAYFWCGKHFDCAPGAFNFYETGINEGKCCVGNLTFSAPDDDSATCCYDGKVIASDSIANKDVYCLQGQLYESTEYDLENEEIIPVDMCGPLTNGGTYTYNDLDYDGWYKLEGDTSEEQCGWCGNPSTWFSFEDVNIGGSCCGDDGYTDFGRIVLDNYYSCYNNNWMQASDANVMFNIYTINDNPNYDILSNSEEWHICDPYGSVINSKSGIQLPDGGYLNVPSDQIFDIDYSSVQETEEEGTLNFDYAINNHGITTESVEETDFNTETYTVSYADIASRFICAGEDSKGKFIECCPSSEVCINKDEGQYALPGTFIHTIKEFNTDCDKQYCPYTWGLKTSRNDNYYFRIYLNDKEFTTGVQADSDINRWTDYNYLEFYVYVFDDLNLGLRIGQTQISNTAGDSASDYKSFTIENIFTSNDVQILNGKSKGKWMRIRIPTTIGNTLFSNVNIIEFYVNKNVAESSGIDFAIGDINYHNIIAIDKIHLVKENNDFVCSGEEYEEGILDNLWIKDLDSDQTSCEAVPGYSWSGTQCCGDDANEYYIDGNNYCWDGNLLKPGQSITDISGRDAEDYDLLYGTDGAFYTCSDRTSITHGSFIISTSRVIQNCYVKDNHVCSPDGRWSSELYGLTNIEERDTVKLNVGQTPGTCCADTQCWNGIKCLDGVTGFQEGTSLENLAGGSWGDEVLKACVFDNEGSADWQDVYLSEKWDSTSVAYCPTTETCWNGDECIFEGTFLSDYYCDDGGWATRTKLLASKLLQVAITNSPTDYTLYCDISEDTLPYTRYEPLQTFIMGESANNFCVLNMDNKIVVGTSLNGDKLNDFLRITDLDCTDFDENSDIYQSCDGNTELWYNSKYNTLIYSKEGVILNEENSEESFDLWVKNPLDSTVNFILNLIKPIRTIFGTTTIYNEDYLKSVRDFNRLFLGKLDNKEIMGVIEQVDPDHAYLIVDYNKFKTDICRLVSSPNVFCQPIINTNIDNTYAQYKLFSFDYNNFEDIWQFATSSLRLKSKTEIGLAPSPKILSPVGEETYEYGETIILEVSEPEDDLSYYWDVDSTGAINGHLRGVKVFGDVEDLLRDTVGTKTVSLIALNKHGRFGLDQVNIVKN